MQAFWTIRNDEDGVNLEAEVVRCVKTKDRINLIFKGTYNREEPVEARISLKQTGEHQMAEGVWIFPDKQKEQPRFSERESDSEAVIYKAKVTGSLESFEGERVIFTGVWDETDSNPSDGCIYDFGLEAEYT